MKKIKPGTVFMITGGAKGIGAATAALVVEQGGKVAVCDVDQDSMEAVCDELGDAAVPVPLDVRDREAWDRAIEHAWEVFGHVDVLVNNAGVAFSGDTYLLPFEKHRQMIEVNLVGPIHGIQAVVPRFLEQGYGHVVNIGSLAGFAPGPQFGGYCATKHALRAFSHSCALELTGTPVTFTLVCPDSVETPMLDGLSRETGAVLVFSSTPMSVRKVAEAVIRAVVDRPYEILLPPRRGFLVRVLGLFPGLTKLMLSRGYKRGEKALMERRQRDVRRES